MKFHSKTFLILLALASPVLFPWQSAAQTVTWGGSDGNWTVPGDWTSGAVPGSGTDATIDSGTAELPFTFSGTAGNVIVADSGTATLSVSSGYLSDADATIGNVAGSSGSGTIAPLGGWNNSGTVVVGNSGTGTLTVEGGVVTTAAGGVIGNLAGSNGTVTITSGSWINAEGSIIAGNNGDGVLNLNGGVLQVPGSLLLASGGNSTGTLNFSSGTLNALGVNGGAGAATVNFTTASGSASTFAPQLAGDLSVNQTGAGDTTLTGSETYTGATTVSAGTLTVNGSINNSAITVSGGLLNGSGTTGNVSVTSGGALGGTLTGGVVMVSAGGTVTAGDAPGENTMTSLALSGSATYAEQIVVPGGGSYTGPGNHPIAGTDYGQTTLNGSGNGQTALTLDSTNSILRLNVTGSLPAGGVGVPGVTYNPTGSNSSLDNCFVLHLSNSTDTISGEFAQVTADGVNFVAIDYSSGNLAGSSSVGTFTLDEQEWAISYTGDEADNSTTGGDDVVLTAIPEPSSYVLLALGAVVMTVLVRRRMAPMRQA
jgi:autotransporter-associated beta strand protein/T5SS/PEP-CTERM-associated repeat protein